MFVFDCIASAFEEFFFIRPSALLVHRAYIGSIWRKLIIPF